FGARFFFQAEDGIRDRNVTGVQTCALPICGGSIGHVNNFGMLEVGPQSAGATPGPASYGKGGELPTVTDANLVLGYLEPDAVLRSEERRVGKECRSRGPTAREKRNRHTELD